MEWLTEDPSLTIGLGTLALVILAVVLYRTGRGVVLVAMVLVLLLTTALVVAERWIVTDRELVADTLYRGARALEANDVPTVKSLIASDSQALHALVDRVMSDVAFRAVHIGGDLEIKINRLTSPPTAVARFTCRVEGTPRRMDFAHDQFIRGVKVTLRQEEAGHWAVAEVEPQQAPLRRR